jgi:alkanesulfonate monooxygenase SsuD/methylene tetrahydromethanopterin reductase-like flavin-dependent oxidoreductase (luciferase family)
VSPAPRVGLRPDHDALRAGTDVLRRLVSLAEAHKLDHLCVGDHISFRDGSGFDGLIQSAALAVLSDRLAVHLGVYLLPLRHPVAVARQISTLAEIAPGRFSFGVGIGGEDPAESRAAGVDPTTRGRRMNEALPILRDLLAGERVTVDGEFFHLDGVRILPVPTQPVPIVVGGRSDAALCRAARYGDGWLAVWVSPRRYTDALDRIAELAATAGRPEVAWRHGMHAWCGFGPSRESATDRVARTMEAFYRVPFDKFDRYTPRGTPQDVAEALLPYVHAGCTDLDLHPVAGDLDEEVAAIGEVRRLLRAELGAEQIPQG